MLLCKALGRYKVVDLQMLHYKNLQNDFMRTCQSHCVESGPDYRAKKNGAHEPECTMLGCKGLPTMI